MTDAILSAKVTADIADFAKKMDQITGAVDKLGSKSGPAAGNTAAAVESSTGGMNKLAAVTGALATAAGVVEVAAVAATRKAAQYAESLQQLSDKTGLSKQTLQELKPLFEGQNVPLEKLIPSVKALAKNYVDATGGSEKAAEKFKALGISAEQLDRLKDPADLLRAIAERVASMPDGLERTAAMSNLLGKSALGLIPVLKGGAAGFDASAKAAHEMGAVLSEDTLAALAKLDDGFDRTKQATDAVSNNFAMAFAPAIESTTKGINTILDIISRGLIWLNENVSEGTREMVGIFVGVLAVGAPLLLAVGGFAPLLGVALAPILIGGAILLAVVAATIAIAANWEDLKNAAIKIWNALKSAVSTTITQMIDLIHAQTIGRLERIWASVGQGIEKVKSMFSGLLTAVVGRSYIPDMVDGIQAEMERLESAAMVDPTARAVEETAAQVKAFEINMTSGVRNATTQTAKILGGAAFTWSDAFSQVATTAVNTWGSITQTVGTSLAKMTDEHVQWGEIVKQIGLQTMGALITQFIQIAAQWAIAQMTMTAASTAGDATRLASSVASNATAAGASAGLWATASAAIGVSLMSIGAAAKALWFEAILPALTAIGSAIVGFLSAVAAAMKATIFGIPVGVAVLIGVGAIIAALAAMRAVRFAHGGIATGPTPAIFGEKGPEVAIPLNKRGAAFVQDAFSGILAPPTFARIGEAGSQAVMPLRVREAGAFGGGEQTIIIELDGRVLARAVSDRMPSVWRIQGLPA